MRTLHLFGKRLCSPTLIRQKLIHCYQHGQFQSHFQDMKLLLLCTSLSFSFVDLGGVPSWYASFSPSIYSRVSSTYFFVPYYSYSLSSLASLEKYVSTSSFSIFIINICCIGFVIPSYRNLFGSTRWKLLL